MFNTIVHYLSAEAGNLICYLSVHQILIKDSPELLELLGEFKEKVKIPHYIECLEWQRCATRLYTG